MKISVSSDTLQGVAPKVAAMITAMGHTVLLRGALDPTASAEWAPASASAAQDVAEGRAAFAVICCHTGTGAALAANKVPGIRAALCTDAYTARGARMWNDANVLAISLRLTSELILREMLDAWFSAVVDKQQAANIAFVNGLDAQGMK